jgi:hypothetical protein
MDIKTLADAVEQVPAIAAEIDQIKTDARAEVQSRIDAASPYLTSEYPEAIKTLAIGVLKGDKNPAALEGAVVALDAMTESNKVAAAADETTAQGDTPAGSGPTQPSADGTIATEEQYAAEVAQFRSAHGQEG